MMPCGQFAAWGASRHLFKTVWRFCTHVLHYAMGFNTLHVLILKTHGNCDHPLIEIREVSFEKLAEFIIYKNTD